MSGWLSDVGNGAAQRLADHGIGTWDPDDGTGNINRGSIPPDICPAIGLQAYRFGPDNPAQPSAQVRLQFWLRAADIDALDDLDAAIADLFIGLNGVTFGAVTVTDCNSISALPQGLDSQGNPERSCNYSLELDLPPTALRSN